VVLQIAQQARTQPEVDPAVSALSLVAEGSCTIGAISPPMPRRPLTGRPKPMGWRREMALGLEVVLADGRPSLSGLVGS